MSTVYDDPSKHGLELVRQLRQMLGEGSLEPASVWYFAVWRDAVTRDLYYAYDYEFPGRPLFDYAESRANLSLIETATWPRFKVDLWEGCRRGPGNELSDRERRNRNERTRFQRLIGRLAFSR